MIEKRIWNWLNRVSGRVPRAQVWDAGSHAEEVGGDMRKATPVSAGRQAALAFQTQVHTNHDTS